MKPVKFACFRQSQKAMSILPGGSTQTLLAFLRLQGSDRQLTKQCANVGAAVKNTDALTSEPARGALKGIPGTGQKVESRLGRVKVALEIELQPRGSSVKLRAGQFNLVGSLYCKG